MMKIKHAMNNILAFGEDLKASPKGNVTVKKNPRFIFASIVKRGRKLYTLQRLCLHPSISVISLD